MPDGRVARSSATASNDELRSAIVLANDAAVRALVAQGKSLASLTDHDGALDDLRADQQRRENLALLERMAAELRSEEGAHRAAAGPDRCP
jgi:hypothetical protein